MQGTTQQILGGLFAYAREMQGITRPAFAEILGIRYNQLWDIERGHRTLSIKRLNFFIEKLNITQAHFWSLYPAYYELFKHDATTHTVAETTEPHEGGSKKKKKEKKQIK